MLYHFRWKYKVVIAHAINQSKADKHKVTIYNALFVTTGISGILKCGKYRIWLYCKLFTVYYYFTITICTILQYIYYSTVYLLFYSLFTILVYLLF